MRTRARVPGGVIGGVAGVDVRRRGAQPQRLEHRDLQRGRRTAGPTAASITAPSREKPTLEYLNRSLRGSTVASSAAMRRNAGASGNGWTSCQWSPSRPSRVTPPPWASSSRSVTRPTGSPTAPAASGATSSSSRRSPRSASCTTAVAVNVLECEAMRKRWSVVSGVPASTSARPWALDSTISSPNRTAAWTPGIRSRTARYASHVSA